MILRGITKNRRKKDTDKGTGRDDLKTQRAEQQALKATPARSTTAGRAPVTGTSSAKPAASYYGLFDAETQRAEQQALKATPARSTTAGRAPVTGTSSGQNTDPFAGLDEKLALRTELSAFRQAHKWQERNPEQKAPPGIYRDALINTLAKSHAAETELSPAIPKEFAGLAGLVAKLPDDFPIESWYDKSAVEQQKIISRTDLTRQEQWAILNSGPAIDTIALIQDIEANRWFYGLTRREANDITAKLWEIGNLRTGARNHDIPSLHGGAANARFIADLDRQQAELLDTFGYEKQTFPYLGDSAEYETTPDGVAIVRIEPKPTAHVPALPMPSKAEEISVYDAFQYYGLDTELGVNASAPYFSDTIAYLQQQITEQGLPLNESSMQAVLDGIRRKYYIDMATDPVATSIRVNLPETPGGALVDFALRYLGMPYTTGGNKGKDADDSEEGGLDCSGLVFASVLDYAAAYNPDAFGRLYEDFDNNAATQASRSAKNGTIVWSNPAHNRKAAIPLNELQTGDIVYWYSTTKDKIGHTGLYVGNDCVIEASSMENDSGVVLRDLSSRTSYDKLIIDSIIRPDLETPKKEQP